MREKFKRRQEEPTKERVKASCMGARIQVQYMRMYLGEARKVGLLVTVRSNQAVVHSSCSSRCIQVADIDVRCDWPRNTFFFLLETRESWLLIAR